MKAYEFYEKDFRDNANWGSMVAEKAVRVFAQRYDEQEFSEDGSQIMRAGRLVVRRPLAEESELNAVVVSVEEDGRLYELAYFQVGPLSADGVLYEAPGAAKRLYRNWPAHSDGTEEEA